MKSNSCNKLEELIINAEEIQDNQHQADFYSIDVYDQMLKLRGYVDELELIIMSSTGFIKISIAIIQ